MHKIRKGTPADIPFLIDAILYSERSGTAYSFYERAFEFNEQEVRQFLKDILEENLPGSELCYENFHILMEDGKPVATLSSWVEEKGNKSSNFIKSSIFGFLLPRATWLNAQPAIQLINKISIERSPDTPQFESVYIDPEYRGRGLLKVLMDKTFNGYYEQGFQKVEMISVVNNIASKKAFVKCGFAIKKQTTSDNAEIEKFFPGQGKILWIRK